MPPAELVADYVVVGSGAMGMAFTDVLLAETDATVILIDRHHRPGGHWNDAYPFVRLHQPSAFYGVNSRALGSGVKDRVGWNAGLYELASGAEVCAYFDQVMQQQFLPSGRVQYFPRCEWQGDGRFFSLASGREQRARARRRTVDATYMNVVVPSVRPPPYALGPGVRCVPINGLATEARTPSRYVVVGAGKTGMDAVLWLLANQVDPEAIAWIMPRDSWLLDRAAIQPAELAGGLALGVAKQMAAIAGADSVDALLDAVHAVGQLLRLDDSVRPTMYRCATVTRAELEQLRRVRNVIRLGRVKRLERDRIELENGEQPCHPDTLFVDCSADGLARRPAVPVFAGERIALQSVRTCQQVFSAAFIAHVEASYADDAEKNALCGVIPHPDSHVDFLRTTLANAQNTMRWAQDPALTAWVARSRLDIFHAAAMASLAGTSEIQEAQRLLLQHTGPAVATLQRLLAQ
ncbi:MAG TPA: FAD/NAD(P)-binding protein [Myxococcota bacterium]|nr:FAD/NAD(P)-binding protein [Myxococcota bacterium]